MRRPTRQPSTACAEQLRKFKYTWEKQIIRSIVDVLRFVSDYYFYSEKIENIYCVMPLVLDEASGEWFSCKYLHCSHQKNESTIEVTARLVLVAIRQFCNSNSCDEMRLKDCGKGLQIEWERIVDSMHVATRVVAPHPCSIVDVLQTNSFQLNWIVIIHRRRETNWFRLFFN